MGKVKTIQRGVKPAAAQAKEYNPYLDVLKGFAILLVVLGHSLQTFVANGQFDNNLLFKIIYSFHMPLFMFLAGAAATYSHRPMNFAFVRRKFYMLVVPFVAWYLVGYGLDGTYHQLAFKTYIHRVIDSPDYGLWFLWVLFLNFVVLVGISKMTKWFKLYSYLIAWLVIYSIPTGKYGIGLLKWHLPFFLLGYLIFTYRHQLQRFRKIVLITYIATTPFLVATWHRLYYPSYITGLQPRLIAHGLQTVSMGSILSVNVYQVMALAYSYFVPLAAIGTVYWLFQLRPSKYLWPILGFFGLYTLDIYAIHVYLFRYAFGHSWLEIGSGFVIAASLSVLIGILILRRVPLLSTLFLGGRSKPAGLLKKYKFSFSGKQLFMAVKNYLRPHI